MPDPSTPDPRPTPETLPYERKTIGDRVRRFLHDYAWWIAKNVLGWLLILLSPILGAAVPGPGGIPVFLIGFAMVTFPGKRHLTARVFRGIPLNLKGNPVGVFSGMTAVLLPLVVAIVLRVRYEQWLEREIFHSPYIAGLVLGSMAVSYVLARLFLHGLNWVIRLMPRIRRLVRPKMRHMGVDLLPPRRRRRLRAQLPGAVDQEILEIDPSYGKKASAVWKRAKPWIKRAATIILVVVLFYYMLRPVSGRWHEVGDQIRQYNPWRFLLASALFALFLAFFRGLTWLKMIKGFGYRIPLAAGLRIFVSGELARYLPGTVWQVLGRVHLIKPYGVPKSVCATSQILEIATFLLANIFIGLGCLLWFMGKADAAMQPYLIGALVLLPLLTLALHPKIFYGVANRILRRLGKPAFSQRLRGKKLTKYFFAYLLGLAFQSVAIYVLLGDALHIKEAHWWKLAGPYCLAWCAGFIVGFMSPGGLGVREYVFVGMLTLTLDQGNRDMLPQGAALHGFLVFCSVLLRLWTIAGEMMVAGITHVIDYKGALNRPDAPGRVATTPPEEAELAEPVDVASSPR